MLFYLENKTPSFQSETLLSELTMPGAAGATGTWCVDARDSAQLLRGTWQPPTKGLSRPHCQPRLGPGSGMEGSGLPGAEPEKGRGTEMEDFIGERSL